MLNSPAFRLLLCALLFFTGCAATSPHHANTPAQPQNSIIPPKDGKAYQLAVIEFGEQGSFQDTSQLLNATALIQKTSRPLVITYIHGWHNDGGSQDLSRFAELLAQLGDSPAIKKEGFHIIGVYLGWRGEIITFPVLNQLTFWNRKAAAERLASNYDCYDAISSISAATRAHGREQTTILMGHSFGGLVAERSVAHAINASLHNPPAATSASPLPADFILLLNPASDSILTRQMMESLYLHHVSSRYPFIVSVTSKTDSATDWIFRTGTNLAAISKHFDPVTPPGHPTTSEHYFFTNTPGHNPTLINYRLVKVGRHLPIRLAPGESAFDANLQHNLVGNGFLTDPPAALRNQKGVEDSPELWQLQPIDPDLHIPYWIVAADTGVPYPDAIIKGHTGIWNTRALDMVAGLFRISYPMEKIDPSSRQVPSPASILSDKSKVDRNRLSSP